MPRFLARSFTVLMSDSGSRMLTRADFFSNSNWTSFPERSYSDRSAVATNSSASSSVWKVGIFFNLRIGFFIGLDLFPVHIACAERANEITVRMRPHREEDEHMASAHSLADRAHSALFIRRVAVVRHDD